MDSIREKATQLGIDPGSSTNREDNLRTIANQLGLDESSSTDSYAIEKKLDELLAENNSQNKNLNDEYYNDVPEEVQEGAPEQRQRFGEQEYNQARNENGKYDKDYYKNKQKDLDKELQNAKDEKARDWKYINPENKDEQDNNKKNSDLEKEKSEQDNLNKEQNKEKESQQNSNQNKEKESQQNSNQNNKPEQDQVRESNKEQAKDTESKDKQSSTDNKHNINPNKVSGPVKADGSNTRNKSKWDKAKDNIRLANAKNNQIQNKINNAKANMYKMSHPGEYLKDQATAKVKEVGKETASKAGKAVAKGAKEAGKAVGKAAVTGIKAIIQFLAANPHVAAALAVIALILGIIIFLMAIAASNTGTNSASAGYYDYVCDFNQTTVAYTDTSTTNLEIGEFVKGVTYNLIKDKELSNNQIKALMIAVKTNALSSGNYVNDNKNISISSGTMLYESYGDMEDKLASAYEDISGYLYLPNTYVDTITSLTPATALDININNFVAYTGSYESILSAIYPDENLALYDLSDNCSYLIASGSDTYWWPVPSKLSISSPFSPYRCIGEGANRVCRAHNAIDIPGTNGADVIASKAGTVTAVVDKYGSGGCSDAYLNSANYIKIKHDDGTETWYWHLKQGTIKVAKDQRVEQGQVIAAVGNSGKVCGSGGGYHLHFSILVNGKFVDPEDYVDPKNPRPVSIEGSSNQQTVCKVLLSKGFSNDETAALMINIQAESGFNPNIVGDHGTSYGLCQWHNPSRWDKLKEYRPDSWKTIPGQIDYLKYELNNSFTSVYSYLKGSNTISEKATYFCMNFEKPANSSVVCPKRASDYATSMMNYVNNGCQ